MSARGTVAGAAVAGAARAAEARAGRAPDMGNAETVHARFEQFEGHRSIVVDWRPAGTPRAHAVFFPAYGDEMNQSRRMVKLAARALAERGIASRVFDVHGTGDSSADFSEATVTRWLADCRQVVEQVQAEATGPLLLMGCRLGTALASQASHWLAEPAALLLGWAPVLQGKLQLSGMLRVDKVSRMQRNAAPGGEPKARWAAGEPAFLSGYPVSAALAEQLEAFDATRAPRAAQVLLVEVRLPAGDEPVAPTEPLRKRAAAWGEQGVPSEAQAVAGAGFWNVADLVDVPELVELTVAAAERALASPNSGDRA